MNDNELKPSFGGFESPVDYRDITIGQAIAGVKVELPMKFVNNIDRLPVWHQRKIGACVGHAHCKYKQKLDLMGTDKLLPWSSRFVYGISKCLDGFSGEGTYPRLAMKVLKDYGCPTENTMPNDTTLDHETYVFNRRIENIPSAAIQEAKKYKISGYASVPMTKDGIMQACVHAGGLSMLVKLNENWWSDKKGTTWEASRLLPIKPPTSNVVSGHQIYVYGYETVGEDMKIYFLNSWSTDWADRGRGWFWFSEYGKYLVEGWTAMSIPDNLIEEIKKLPAEFTYTFKGIIKYGTRSEDVKALQRALKVDGVYNYDVTGYYGDITAAAVKRFQRKYNIASIQEINSLNGRQAGPKTIAKLNELFSK
jgi:hypothetical protein